MSENFSPDSNEIAYMLLVMNEMCLWGVLQAIKGLILMKIGTMF